MKKAIKSHVTVCVPITNDSPTPIAALKAMKQINSPRIFEAERLLPKSVMITGGPLIALAPFKIPEAKPAAESTDGFRVKKLRRDVHKAMTDKSKTKAITNRIESSETCDKASKPKGVPMSEPRQSQMSNEGSALPLSDFSENIPIANSCISTLGTTIAGLIPIDIIGTADMAKPKPE